MFWLYLAVQLCVVNYGWCRFKDFSFLSGSLVEQWAQVFSHDVYETSEMSTQAEKLAEHYQGYNAVVEEYDPEELIDFMKHRLETFMGKRRQLVEVLKRNLENSFSLFQRVNREAINDLESEDFYQFVDAKKCYIRVNPDPLLLNTSIEVTYTVNANFYNLPVNVERSAVHVPTPIYSREPELLNEIRWSESLDAILKARRTREFFAASWQYFCSNTGFMRYYPASPWFYDDPYTCLDLYDCRNSEWYIDASTHAKNIVIILDVSGSMLGQRFEIAKQTIEMIMETLTENDFFNLIAFSNEPRYILPCFKDLLVQATIRNKKLIRAKLNNFTAEGIANYPAALTQAFELLTSANTTSNNERIGCHSAILLITDGTTDTYDYIFDKYNANKTIRFFSFLIGDDVKEFREVRYMACNNRGFFVHISNLADVQEKVQSYVTVMSRPLAEHNSSNPVWTGAYYDRMGSKLVTTVASPVVANDTFRGVAGVAAPVTEMQQMAGSYMLGANAYSFIVDNNGYIVYHPQLRPLHLGKPKPNYNSIDVMELEVIADNRVENGTLAIPVNYDNELRRHLVDGSSSRTNPRKYSMKILWSIDGSDSMRRVYSQKNVYYFRGINNTLMTLVLAVPDESRYRVMPAAKKLQDRRHIQLEWFAGSNWRLHPDWHYCRPNDSNADMSREEVFLVYLKHYIKTGRMPRNCAMFEFLIRKLLFDAEVTSRVENDWLANSRLNPRKGIHLVFLAATSGLTRYASMNLEDVRYLSDYESWPEADNTSQQFSSVYDRPYVHFIKRHIRAVDEVFYKRAVQFPHGEYVIDVNVTNLLYLNSKSGNFRDMPDNRSAVVTASRAVFLEDLAKNRAPAVVVGFEMLYLSFEEMMLNASNKLCRPGSPVRCYLLDEHGYVIYASPPQDTKEQIFYLRNFFGRLSPEYTVNGGVERFLMKKLVDKYVYKEVTFVDFQALCVELNLHSFSKRLINPFLALAKLLFWCLESLYSTIVQWSFWSLIAGLISRINGYTPTFHDIHEGLACDKASSFYLLNKDFRGPVTLSEDKIVCSAALRSADKAYQKKMSCNLKAYAVRIKKTNLVLVVYSSDNSRCDDDLCKAYFMRQNVPFEFTVVAYATDKLVHPSGCKTVSARYRRSPSVCYPIDDRDPPSSPCSSVKGHSLMVLMSLGLSGISVILYFAQ